MNIMQTFMIKRIIRWYRNIKKSFITDEKNDSNQQEKGFGNQGIDMFY